MMAKNPKDERQAEMPLAPAAETGTALTVIDYGDDEGAGLEDVRRDELSLPFFRILQSNSPQVTDETIEGAKAGMILNLATGEIYDGDAGVEFIPAFRDHNFVEYVSRDAGGGFVGVHDPEEPMILDLQKKQGMFGKLTTGDHEISETYYLYGLLVGGEDQVSSGVIAFSSTQIKKFKAFMGRVVGIKYRKPDGREINPPMWAHRWRLQTVAEKNKKGRFYGWKITLVEEPPLRCRLATDHPLYQRAKELNGLIKEGLATVKYEQSGVQEEQAPAAAADPNDEIPF